MLTLSRYEGESIIIGSDIVVTVLEVRQNKVRLGVRAPLDLRVDREEVRRRIEARQTAAHEPGPDA